MSDREAFEKWARDNGIRYQSKYSTGEYYFSDADLAWKAWQAAKAQAGQPIAAVHGWFHGECVIRALDPEAVLPAGMALYSQPQSIPDCHGIANGKRTEDMSKKELRYHMQELSAMCYRQADELEALKAQAVNQQLPAARVWNQAEGRDGKLYAHGWNDCLAAIAAAQEQSK